MTEKLIKSYKDYEAAQGKSIESGLRYNKGLTYEELERDIKSVEENKAKLEDKFANGDDFKYCKEVYKKAKLCMDKHAKYPKMQ